MSVVRSGPDEKRFHLLEVLGRGAFGEVYLAEQESGLGFRRRVALKVLSDTRRRRDPGQRLRDEARILGLFTHRHVVGALDLVEVEGCVAIVMEYVPGADLRQVLDALDDLGEPFPAPAALEVGAAVLDALDAAATADDGRGGVLAVVHRDIKPGNVRLTPDGDVKVLDFGVARFSLDLREARTHGTGLLGTELYMAPERILCDGDTPAGDVYAACATVVELLIGRPLGRSPAVASRHEALVDGALEELRARLAGAAPEDADALIQALRRGLAATPTARPPARELAEELERLSRRVPGEPLRGFARRFVPGVPKPQAPLRASRMTGETRSTARASPRPAQARWVALGSFAVAGVPLALLLVAGETAVPAPPVEPPAVVAPLQAPRAARPPPPPVAAPAAVLTAPAPPTIGRALVSAKGASRVSVACGAVASTGDTSARLADFPAGTCRAEVTYADGVRAGELVITKPGRYSCRVKDGGLLCS